MKSTSLARLLAALGLSVGAAGCSRADLYAVTGPSAADGAAEATTGGVTASETFYVTPDGDDANPGTLALPLRTLSKARDLVRTRTGTMTGDFVVYVRGGTYPQTSALVFGSGDSGTGGFYVKYMAYPGERPLITGGRAIRGWSLSDSVRGIYAAPAGGSFRQLYVNGVKAVRARTPNLGAGGAANFNRLTGFDSSSHNVQLPSADVSNWANLTEVEMHVMTAWADNTLRVASVTSSGGTAYVKFQAPEDGILFVRPNPRLDQRGWGSGRAYYFENALELLDQAGEWYLDEAAQVVYYKPRDGEDMDSALVVAPTLETVLRVEGSSTSDLAGYLWFQGLTFAHSTYLRPSEEGFLDGQAGQYSLTAQANNDQTVGRPSAGVTVQNAEHVRFERNLFTQMAATGLDLISGTHDDAIVGNAFTDIGGSGISIGKFVASDTTEYHSAYNPSDKAEICTRDSIRNNFIDAVTTEIQGACGIAAGYPAYVDIEHNEILRTNFTGISVGYGWTASANAMTNNVIDYNEIHDVADILAGGAGISVMSNQGPASEIRYNYLHDFGDSSWADYSAEGLFLDEGTTGYSVAYNVLRNTPGVVLSSNSESNLVTDNGASPTGVESTLASAGIEPDYADVKELAIPPASF